MTHEKVPRTPRVVRIFLSSPGDVADERRLAQALIEQELAKHPIYRGRVTFELIAWDDPRTSIPMVATETPQVSVITSRPRPATCDFVIVILWSRMGTPLPDTIRKPNGGRYLSGTEWEYEDAVNSPRDPRPVVLVYRRSEEPMISLRDRGKKEKEEQFEKVETFFERFRDPDGSITGGVNEYAKPADCKAQLALHLHEKLYALLGSGDRDPDKGADPPPIVPPEYLDWVKRTHAPVDLLGQETGKGQAPTLDTVYVPVLTQRPKTPPQEGEGELPRPKKPEERLMTMLERIDAESCTIPAVAGAGKSTFCRWAALQCVSGADLTHPIPAPDEIAEPVPASLLGRLPLLVPLREFSATMDCGLGRRQWRRKALEAALAAWVDADPPAGLTGALVRAHLRAGSLLLLLDGLDEVPASEIRGGRTVFPRHLLLSGLADALLAWRKSGNRIVLTSRPYGLDQPGLPRPDLPEAPVEPLPQAAQRLFIARWFHALKQDKLAEGLIASIENRDDPHLDALAENPMLLTGLCVVYGTGRRLPGDRYHLYRRLVETVLLNRYPGDVGEREPVKARLSAIALGMHTGGDVTVRRSPAASVTTGEAERWLRQFAEGNPHYEKDGMAPAVRLEGLLTKSGLLLPREEGKLAFYHLSFQEFLAAERIARTQSDAAPLERLFQDRGSTAEWRPTLLFLFAAQIFNFREKPWGFDLLRRLAANQTRDAVKGNPAMSAFIAEAVELCLLKNYEIPPELTEMVRRIALACIEDEIEVQARQALGLVLGRLGDPRIPDLRDPDAFIEVTAGSYPIGEEEEEETIEIVAPFLLARTPVTNSQYQAFIDVNGYNERRWWSDTGWTWRQEEGATEPRFWRERRWNAPNQPVVGVSFWEAEACAAWAGGRLPTEREWEAAARGPSGRDYPWGGDWRDGICNSDEFGLGATSPVGLFPSSRQADFGFDDLAGNVWEWSGGFFASSVDANVADRVVRGASWSSFARFARSAYRAGFHPDFRFIDLGFRCALDPGS